ncbi:hypothetical protein GQ600_3111 [Phytophthora cactorum]|nr:hypothetical protein GQ600_3111 [Phytophthora cactorum]
MWFVTSGLAQNFRRFSLWPSATNPSSNFTAPQPTRRQHAQRWQSTARASSSPFTEHHSIHQHTQAESRGFSGQRLLRCSFQQSRRVCESVGSSGNVQSLECSHRDVRDSLDAVDGGALCPGHAGYNDCRLQSRSIVQLHELEASRLVEMNKQAANIQKIWKGRKTRQLIAKYIKGSEA